MVYCLCLSLSEGIKWVFHFLKLLTPNLSLPVGEKGFIVCVLSLSVGKKMSVVF